MASSSGGERCHVCRLPVEIVELEAVQLPTSDLASLRSTCRDINNKVLRAFVQEAFGEMTFLLGVPCSMQILEDISNHPMFSKAITNLTFTLQRLPKGRADDRKLRDQQQQLNGKRIFDREERIKHRELRIEHQRICNEAESFWKTFAWRGVWTRCFANLRKSKNATATIGVTLSREASSLSPKPSGAKSLRRRLGYEDCLGRYSAYSQDTTERFVTTVLFSGLRLHHFKIPDPHVVMRKSDLDAISKRPSLNDRTAHVRELALGLPLPWSFKGGYGSDGLKKILAACTQLSHFELITSTASYNDRSRLHDIFDDVAKSLFIPNLESVVLGVPWLSKENLVKFVKRHQSSLKRIATEAIKFPEFWPPCRFNNDRVESIACGVQIDVGIDKLKVELFPSDWNQ